MRNDAVVYSLEGRGVPISYTNRADAPERGDVFTAQAIERKGKRDLVIDAIPYHTGYIKKNLRGDVQVVSGEYYRFKIVGGPHQKNHHNYFSVIPLRELRESEGIDLNRIDGQNSLLIQRVAEFMLGIGWNREKRENYILSESQRSWDWFRRNLM